LSEREGYAHTGGQRNGRRKKYEVAKAKKEDTELLFARYEGALEALTHDMDKAVGDLPQFAKGYGML